MNRRLKAIQLEGLKQLKYSPEFKRIMREVRRHDRNASLISELLRVGASGVASFVGVIGVNGGMPKIENVGVRFISFAAQYIVAFGCLLYFSGRHDRPEKSRHVEPSTPWPRY